jgi:hypothetical protein
MTETPRITQAWVCPICTDRIDIVMWWEEAGPPSLLRVRKIDDINARVHMEWHRMCTCHWEHIHVEYRTDPVDVRRHPTPGCEMHP